RNITRRARNILLPPLYFGHSNAGWQTASRPVVASRQARGHQELRTANRETVAAPEGPESGICEFPTHLGSQCWSSPCLPAHRLMPCSAFSLRPGGSAVTWCLDLPRRSRRGAEQTRSDWPWPDCGGGQRPQTLTPDCVEPYLPRLKPGRHFSVE